MPATGTRRVRKNKPNQVWAEDGWVDEEPSVESPATSALKADWVAHAEARGIDTTGMTKAEIIAAVEE